MPDYHRRDRDFFLEKENILISRRYQLHPARDRDKAERNGTLKSCLNVLDRHKFTVWLGLFTGILQFATMARSEEHTSELQSR